MKLQIAVNFCSSVQNSNVQIKAHRFGHNMPKNRLRSGSPANDFNYSFCCSV